MKKKYPVKVHVRAGDVYGRLTVIEEVTINSDKYRRVLCSCSCGLSKIVRFKGLRRGGVKSCGCLRKDVLRTYRLTEGEKHPLYLLWRGMKTRCYNQNSSAFKTYGARGIRFARNGAMIQRPLRAGRWSRGGVPASRSIARTTTEATNRGIALSSPRPRTVDIDMPARAGSV